MRLLGYLLTAGTVLLASCTPEHNIDRAALVGRNNPVLHAADTLAALTVGNGGFAFTVDVTGLQTFPQEYANGVPLGTFSDWAWHSFPNEDDLHLQETFVVTDFGHGHPEVYSAEVRDGGRAEAASKWFRANPHRLHLGTIGLDLQLKGLAGISEIDQKLDMMEGCIVSHFKAYGTDFDVKTACHPDFDAVSTDITSKSRTPIFIRFPYPTGQHSDWACNFGVDSLHTTKVLAAGETWAKVLRIVDETIYYVSLYWNGKASFSQTGPNELTLQPLSDRIRLTCLYSPTKPESANERIPSCSETFAAAKAHWKKFWDEGAAIDFSDCSDPRAAELERRVVQSQYLLAVNCAGNTPPQETGLTYNSWFGKFHMEMLWWHQAWAPLWGHPAILSNTMQWYKQALPVAREIAERQWFDGVRWMKMTDPSAHEAPSNTGNFLIWQQPHIIYLADLVNRRTADNEFFTEMYPMVELTANFMADYAQLDPATGRYNLFGYIPAQETLHATKTVNSPLELAYWRYGLITAQRWRQMADKSPSAVWDSVIVNLSPLAIGPDSTYSASLNAEQLFDSTRIYSDHPAVLAALGMIPETNYVNKEIMSRTLDKVMSNWNWASTWGWDYPLAAMCATRLGRPDDAINLLLMETQKNTYLPNGHNYQDGRLRCYLPGNGGLLTAVALMCAGSDTERSINPGFPKNGKWNVHWEGLQRLP